MAGTFTKLMSFFNQSKRVWRILKKPTGTEYKTVAKVSALGILIIGLAGFIVTLIVKSVWPDSGL